MPITSTAALAAARASAASILDDVKALQNLVKLAQQCTTTIAVKVQALTNAELAAFANEIGEDHYVLLNSTISSLATHFWSVNATLGAIISYSTATEFTIPASSPPPGYNDDLNDVLASQSRQLVYAAGVYTVQVYP